MTHLHYNGLFWKHFCGSSQQEFDIKCMQSGCSHDFRKKGHSVTRLDPRPTCVNSVNVSSPLKFFFSNICSGPAVQSSKTHRLSEQPLASKCMCELKAGHGRQRSLREEQWGCSDVALPQSPWALKGSRC